MEYEIIGLYTLVHYLFNVEFILHTLQLLGTEVAYNPFESEARINIFKNSARTSKRTPHFTMTAINLLTLFKKIIPVCTENHTKPKK
jgi:hypothetical protein